MEINTIKSMTREQLLTRDTVLTMLTEEPIRRCELENALIDKAREYKAVTQIKNLIKAANSELKEAMKRGNTELANKSETALDTVNNPWISNEKGVYQVVNGKLEIACLCPISIKEILADIENDTWRVKLAFAKHDPGNPGKMIPREIIVPRQTIADYHKILDLANYGVGVTSQTAKNLVQFLSLCEVNMENPIPIRRSLSRFGWAEGKDGSREFVPYCQDIYFSGEEALSGLKKAISVVDDGEAWEDWINLYKDIRKNTKTHPEPQLFVSAALASVLINPLKETPFLLNLWSESGSGKTITLQLAASVWGAPGEYISDSDSTVNALVTKASILFDLPLIADDFAKAARDQKQLSNLVYALSSGKEKDRLNSESKLKDGKRWHGCTITSNESPLSDDSQKGGALNRILDIQGAPGNIYENPARVIDVCNRSHGFLGERFISAIQNTEGFFDNMRKQQNSIFEELKAKAAAEGRQLEDKQLLPLSLILAVDEYITKYIMRDGVKLNGYELTKHLKSQEQTSDGQRAYQEIIDFISANKSRFINTTSLNDTPTHNLEIYGFLENNNGTNYVHFIPAMFKKMMAEHNRNVKAFCRWADNKGVLVSRDGNQHIKTILNKTRRVYTIILEDVKEPEEEALTELPY